MTIIKVWRALLFLAAAALLSFAVGCVGLTPDPAPALTGSFAGQTPDGRSLRVTLVQVEGAVTGRGEIAGERFELSALTSPQGPMVLAFESGAVVDGRVKLDADGTSATLEGLGEPVKLERGSAATPSTGGPFSGRFAARVPVPLWLDLRQNGDLLAGTGYIDGRPVALVARTDGSGTARGSALFSDESRNGIVLGLAPDGRRLSVSGVGGRFELRRQK